MKVWIDITNSPHVLFFAPIIRRLEEQGHTVTLTARKYAQTEQLLARYGLAAAITGQHKGRSVPAKALGLFNRSTHLVAPGAQGRLRRRRRPQLQRPRRRRLDAAASRS